MLRSTGAIFAVVLVAVAVSILLQKQAMSRPDIIDFAYQEAIGRSERDDVEIVDARAAVGPWGVQHDRVAPGTFERRGIGGGRNHVPHIIFVHGFNVPPSRAIDSGMRFRNLLRESGGPLVRLTVFVWKGNPADLSVVSSAMWNRLPEGFVRDVLTGFLFRQAQDAADISARSLAAYLKDELSEDAKTHPIIVAHSLGARVALAALKERCESVAETHLDGLVLVQAAVHAATLYRWNFRDNNGAVRARRGPYSEALACTQRLVYTWSSRDQTLRRYLRTSESLRESWIPADLPDGYQEMTSFAALGAVPLLKEPLVARDTIPRPGRPQSPDPITTRSRRQMIPHPASADAITLAPLTQGVYVVEGTWTDWEIIGAPVSPIEITAASTVRDSEWWHSPIFDEVGLPNVKAILAAVQSAISN